MATDPFRACLCEQLAALLGLHYQPIRGGELLFKAHPAPFPDYLAPSSISPHSTIKTVLANFLQSCDMYFTKY